MAYRGSQSKQPNQRGPDFDLHGLAHHLSSSSTPLDSLVVGVPCNGLHRAKSSDDLKCTLHSDLNESSTSTGPSVMYKHQ